MPDCTSRRDSVGLTYTATLWVLIESSLKSVVGQLSDKLVYCMTLSAFQGAATPEPCLETNCAVCSIVLRSHDLSRRGVGLLNRIADVTNNSCRGIMPEVHAVWRARLRTGIKVRIQLSFIIKCTYKPKPWRVSNEKSVIRLAWFLSTDYGTLSHFHPPKLTDRELGFSHYERFLTNALDFVRNKTAGLLLRHHEVILYIKNHTLPVQCPC